MAWLGKVSLGGFPDLAGAVTKLSESVKNIEKNFDSALGFEENPESGEASGLWPSTTDRDALFDPVMAFIGHKGGETAVEPLEKSQQSEHSSLVEEQEGIDADVVSESSTTEINTTAKETEALKSKEEDEQLPTEESTTSQVVDSEADSRLPAELTYHAVVNVEVKDSDSFEQKENTRPTGSTEESYPMEAKSETDEVEQVEGDVSIVSDKVHPVIDAHEGRDDQKTHMEENVERGSLTHEIIDEGQVRVDNNITVSSSMGTVKAQSSSRPSESKLPDEVHSDWSTVNVYQSVSHDSDSLINTDGMSPKTSDIETNAKEQHLSSEAHKPDTADSMGEIEKVKMEMKMMETALQGAARQAQAKADEIAELMNENEQLKTVIEDMKRKSNEAEIEPVREEYNQKVATLERKVYALTRERDVLRREQSKKSDAAALLKEKDEIITQVMAEGEELSKKQAAQESHIRKLRAQIKEFEEEKKGLFTKLQVEENKVESVKIDKAVTEKLLQETIEKHRVEVSAQKEYYTNALNAAKEAEALAEAQANNEARTELESHLRKIEEREATLVQTLEELRQTLSRQEQQAAFREDMLRRDVEDLQKRYQASERRCEELITQVPESTRPLLRQIEAMQETTARRAEAWAAVERSLNSRLQEAEAKAAISEESERSMNERLSQTLSRTNVLEAQISCLRAEQTQLGRSLEKERQRAAENRQEYLAVKEEADTHEGRASQLDQEIRELRGKYKQELQDALAQRELLQQDLEKEKAARLDLERTARHQTSA